jgi:TRAP-type C4-dicarboxylate transport system permease small subunit
MNGLRVTLARVDDVIARGEDAFLVVAHALIALLVVGAVVFRYVLHDPLTWSQEFIVGLFTWLIFVGAAAAIRTHMHIRIDAMGAVFARPSLSFLNVLSVVAGAVIVVALLWAGLVNSRDIGGVRTPMLDIAQVWFDGALPVSMALLLVHIARMLVEHGSAAVFASQLESPGS